MDRHSLSRLLTAGYIEQHSLDLGKKRLALEVHVLEGSVLSVHEVVFDRLSHLQFDDEQVAEWDRLELTELWIDSGPESSSTEEWEVSFSLWDLAHVNLRCGSIEIDDVQLR